MKDLKIRVSNEAESKEVQELFFKLGYKWFSGGKNIQHLEQSCSSGFGYLVAWSTGCFTNVIQCGCGAEDAKEITIQDLRDMVNSMKEYLEKQADGSYKLVMRGIVGKDGDIEIPEGANCAILGSENNIYFWKSDSFIGGAHVNWVNMGSGYNAEWYLKTSEGSKLIWKRHTQPEDLPFMDSLNDQYAEIEQVRQSAYDKQEGGSHYKKLAIQPMQYALANKLDYAQANVVKYVTRHADKNGKEDLLKAIHNIELMIEHYYGVEK